MRRAPLQKLYIFIAIKLTGINKEYLYGLRWVIFVTDGF